MKEFEMNRMHEITCEEGNKMRNWIWVGGC